MIQIDWHQAHYLKVLCDEIFEEKNFRNEIIWSYSSGGDYKNTFAKKHDTLFWYTKTDDYTFNPLGDLVGERRGSQKKNNMKKNTDEDGRVYYSIKSAGKNIDIMKMILLRQMMFGIYPYFNRKIRREQVFTVKNQKN